MFDFSENKNQVLSMFPTLNNKNNYFKEVLSYYDTHKNLFEDKEEINKMSNKDIEIIYNKMNRKTLINLAFIGNKKSGKSTTIGHLLLSTGFINQSEFIQTSKLTYDSGLGSYKYSWLLDRIPEERANNKTIIFHIKKFETKKYD